MYSMSTTTEKTTIYLNPVVKRFVQHQAIEENRSMSDVINDYQEDFEDIKLVKERRAEPTETFEAVLKDVGLTYDDLRSWVRTLCP